MVHSDDSKDEEVPRRRVARHHSNDSILSRSSRNGRAGRHPSYELQRSCDRDTNVTNMTGDTLGSMSDDKDDGDFALAPDLADRLVKRTEARVSQVVASSEFVKANCTLQQIPRFDREDFVLGDLIAFGGFSNVYAINHFTVDSELTDEPEEKPRAFVIKHLNPKLAFNPKKLVVGAKDLVMEAHFLSAFDNQNIIKLRGWAAAGISGFSEAGRADGFFLILDRLTITLSKRISRWREDEKVRKTLTKGRQTAKNQFLMIRLKTAIDIASAVAYLHERRILFRDLKPANIGFDPQNILKVFDFGLAVEIPYNEDPETTFKLAGNTGTSRYMAVEVIRKDPYNLKADVFSFSILLWEIMALSKPYDGLLGPQVKESVSLFGERPSVPRSWPVAIRRLLRRGWSESIPNRPTMESTLETLTKVYEASSKSGGKFF